MKLFVNFQITKDLGSNTGFKFWSEVKMSLKFHLNAYTPYIIALTLLLMLAKISHANFR